ncbi:MAG TPA: nucleotidyltransferase domain-containing protein [Solirubrobacteraceae bacterium]|nr:nucleotidyltransferase domain-containing protein [Solirubrobacteraceae bacterium]
MSPASTDRLSLAVDAVKALQALPNVIGLCLIGSVARGDDRPDSDIDILVVVRERQAPSELLAEIPQRLRGQRLSLVCKSRDALARLAQEGSLFLAHARLEGRVVYDPEGLLKAAFLISARTPLNASRELRSRSARLRHYRHLDRFGGNFLFALAHLYGLGKGAAIARSAQVGTPTFVKSDALKALAADRPELREDVEVIQRLRPFYDLTRGHRIETLPFSYLDAAEETSRAVQAVGRLAEVPDDQADA